MGWPAWLRRRETVLALLCSAVVALLSVSGVLAPLERPLSDLMLRLPRPSETPKGPFAVVMIDDAALAAHGPLPWPRTRLAEIITRLQRAGARGVVIDLILADATAEDSDLAMAEALAAGPTVLAAALAPDGGWMLPLPRFGGSRRAAHAHAEVESDGVVRGISTTKQSAGLALPALAIAAAELAGERAAVTPGALLRPDFAEPPAAIPRAGAGALLAGQIPAGLWAGRVVLVGITATGAGDQLLVPVGDRHRPVPGVLVHAAIASSLVRGGLLGLLPRPWTVVLVLAVAGTVQALRTRAGRLMAGPLLLVVVAVLGLALIMLWLGNTIVPLVALLLVAALSALSREGLESREAQRQAGAVLASLLSGEQQASEPVPAGVRGRLQMLQELQSRVVRERDLRRALLDGLAEGVVLWDRSGEPLLANPATSRLWGHPPRYDEVNLAPGDRSELEHGGRILEVECLELADGRLGLLRDITDRRNLEQRRREMQRLVSHELKTPLASLAGFGNMLERYPMSPDELQRVAGLIRTEAERLGEMVTTFLDLERLASGHWRQEWCELDLARLTRERCQLLAAAAAQRQQQLRVDAEDPVMVQGVAQLLSHVIDNLVGNALKYSPDQGVIEVSVSPGRLVVRDHGPGIPAELIPRLGERFFRVPGSGRTGSGLGLALVKEVTDWHGACLTIESEVGTGSRFEVIFATAPGTEQEKGRGGDAREDTGS
jgi:signal transduction histidine kinase